MTHLIKQKGIAIAQDHRSVYVLLGLIACLVLSYVYFAQTAVKTLTKLEELKEKTQTLSVDVSELEARQFAIEGGMSIARAKSLGFVEVQSQTFITKGTRGESLSLKTN